MYRAWNISKESKRIFDQKSCPAVQLFGLIKNNEINLAYGGSRVLVNISLMQEF